ncbi:L-fucose/L-arabinose isomerase family protein [Breznakiella homolactica]|uniref:Fucose isomerase n=1 Tax=Breznakiella homolactica TaxID=2798577 RepID=A0A7T8B9D6_9SPIR|nr:fucose isomerase [Breznakiella homolactica]QQO09514.1 fucose isomerase [Breznakiella homolactica]
MKKHITLGIVCLARKTYDWEAAADIYKGILEAVKKIEAVTWEIVPELVISVEEGRDAALQLAKAHVDGVVCISGTFHLGHLVLELRRENPVPFLLWGLPELPYNGGKIRLNSVCGLNLNASNLYKSGVRDYHASVQNTIDGDWVGAVRILAALKRAKIGIAGFRADGFFNVGVQDNQLFGAMGALVDHYELDEIYRQSVSGGEISARKEQLQKTFDVGGISAEQLGSVASLSAKLHSFYRERNLDALAIRCWPEFARDFGVAPCAAMSLLQSEGMILACEGDIDGAVSMIAHQAIGAETPFLFDFSQVDFDEDCALFWHCGVAPCNLWDGTCQRSLDTYFAGGKGVTADFVLKDGELSVLRIDSALGEYRIFQQKARAVPMEKLLRGTYMKARFDRPVKEVLDLIIDNGFAHHSSVVYGDYLGPVKIFAKFKGWKITE